MVTTVVDNLTAGNHWRICGNYFYNIYCQQGVLDMKIKTMQLDITITLIKWIPL